MNRLVGCGLAMLLLPALPWAAHAQNAAPFQLALFTPAQIVPAGRPVSGLRLNLVYGRNTDVTGVDWGLVNHTAGTGFAWQDGIVNLVEEDFTGWQNGAVNLTRGRFTGYQSGGFNSSAEMHGVAFGLVNRTTRMRGVQVGLVNYTETMHGLQIGVANVIREGRTPFLPVINWSF